jgi:hypothetical protein
MAPAAITAAIPAAATGDLSNVEFGTETPCVARRRRIRIRRYRRMYSVRTPSGMSGITQLRDICWDRLAVQQRSTLADDDQDLRISFLSSAAAKIGSRITEN